MDKHYKDYIQIGLNIMRYRKEQGLTQDQLSEMAGYSRNHLQRVETAGSCVCSCCCSEIGSCSGPKSSRLTMP